MVVKGIILVLNCLLLLFTAPVYFCLAIVFIYFYHFKTFGFISFLFPLAPPLLTAVGFSNFVCGLTTPIFFLEDSGSRKYCKWVLRSMFLIISILQGYCCWMSNELRTIILQDINASSQTREVLNSYSLDQDFQEKWDSLQQEYFCCGVLNFHTGFQDWKNSEFGYQNSVPDSCCTDMGEGCGSGMLEETWTFKPSIFTHGCLTIVQIRLLNEVSNLLVILTVLLGVSMLTTVAALLVSNTATTENKVFKEKNLTEKKKICKENCVDKSRCCHGTLKYPISPDGSYLAFPDPFTTKLSSTV